MARDSMDPGAANVLIAVTPGNGVTFQYRSSDGGGCNNNTASGSAPYWVKLVRSRHHVHRILFCEWHQLDAGWKHDADQYRLHRFGGHQPQQLIVMPGKV